MDSHVMEPPNLWQNYLEPKYRDRAICIERGADGDEVLIVDNKVLLKDRLAALGGAEHDAVQTFIYRGRLANKYERTSGS